MKDYDIDKQPWLLRGLILLAIIIATLMVLDTATAQEVPEEPVYVFEDSHGRIIEVIEPMRYNDSKTDEEIREEFRRNPRSEHVDVLDEIRRAETSNRMHRIHQDDAPRDRGIIDEFEGCIFLPFPIDDRYMGCRFSFQPVTGYVVWSDKDPE